MPADLLQPCPGYMGPIPTTEEQFASAAADEQGGRRCANGKLQTIKKIIKAGHQ